VNAAWQARHAGAPATLLKALTGEAERLCSNLINEQLVGSSSTRVPGMSLAIAELHRAFISEFNSGTERESCRSDIEALTSPSSRNELLDLLADQTRRGYACPVFVRVQRERAHAPAIVVPVPHPSPIPPGDFQDAERTTGYVKHMLAILEYVGADVPAERVRQAVELDRELWADLPAEPPELAEARDFPWGNFLSRVLGPRSGPWAPRVPGLVRRRMARWWAGTPQQLSDWMVCRFAYDFAPFVSDASFLANSTFFAGRVLGVTKPRSRPERFVSLVKTVYPDALAALYSRSVSDQETLERARGLGESLRRAALVWVESMAGRCAIDRQLKVTLETMALEFGDEPARSENSGRTPGTRPAGVCNAVRMARAREVADEHLAVDHPGRSARWKVAPYHAAAYYQRSSNKVVVPWALIREPLIGPGVPDLQAYALLGTIVAHEIAHAALPFEPAEWKRFVEGTFLTGTLDRYEGAALQGGFAPPNQTHYRELAADAIGYAWAAWAFRSCRERPSASSKALMWTDHAGQFMALWATRWRGTPSPSPEGLSHIDRHPPAPVRCDVAPTYLPIIDEWLRRCCRPVAVPSRPPLHK
jgi:predicted metalloendopeptidase